jgi:Mlc titration factor MtfA (ptsG expression regulator)
MWSLSAWRRQRILAKHPIADDMWQRVRHQLSFLDGISAAEDQWLREASVLFLQDKHLTALPGVELHQEQRLLLAAQAQLPLLHLGDLNWYQGFHEIILYPDDFLSPQRHRDASGVEHEWDGEHSGEAWQQGPIILAWPGVMASGDANGLPPLHADMRVSDWAKVMQEAYDDLDRQLDRNPDAETAIDPYAAENPAEFFAVTSEYFFSAPDLLHEAYPRVYEQLQLFYRQDPLRRLKQLLAEDPVYQAHD